METNETLEQKIRRLAQYMDEEAVARAVDREVDFVRAVLAGEAVRAGEEKRGDTTVVRYVRPTFRQRVIHVVRAKGGVGATTLAFNVAWRASERVQTLVIDTAAEISGQTVVSDFTGLLGHGVYEQEVWDEPDVVELADNLHFLPFPKSYKKHTLEEAVLEARNNYDAIIIDSPPLGPLDVGALKSANVLLAVYSGGEAEAERLVRLMESVDKRKDAVYVSTVPKHPLDKYGPKWVYLPRAGEARKGAFDSRSPAGQAVSAVLAEIWGEDFVGRRREQQGGLFGRLFSLKDKGARR